MTTLNENTVEQAALSWLRELGWDVAYGPEIAPDGPSPERDDYVDVVLERRLRAALARLNPGLPVGGAGRRLPQAHTAGGGVAGGPQPLLPSHACGRRHRGVRRGRPGPGRSGYGHGR